MKKKLISTILIVVLILSLSSCTKKQPSEAKEDQSTKTQAELSDNTENSKKTTNNTPEVTDGISKYSLSDFMPKKLNLKLSYSGGFENGGEVSYVEYVEGNRVQIKTSSTGTTVVKVLEEKNDEIRIVYTKEESYEKKNVLQKNSDKTDILLKAPLKVGTSWTDKDGMKESITAIDMDLKTAAGEFKVIEVTKEAKDSVSKSYFAPNLGLVKSVFTTNGANFVTEIKEVKENSPLTETYRFFYYDAEKDKTFYINKTIAQQEKDNLNKLIEENLRKAPAKGLMASVKSTIKINKIDYIEENALVHIDFSKNFVKEMNLGSGSEMTNLQCITNTLGYNYKTSKVLITLDGEPYASGHILMKKGETFKVNYDKISELK